jgi:hypothetical protein
MTTINRGRSKGHNLESHHNLPYPVSLVGKNVGFCMALIVIVAIWGSSILLGVGTRMLKGECRVDATTDQLILLSYSVGYESGRFRRVTYKMRE